MRVKFISKLPEDGRKLRHVRNEGVRQQFVEKLKERPGVWAVYDGTTSPTTAYSFKKNFSGVQATMRNNECYVRWVG